MRQVSLSCVFGFNRNFIQQSLSFFWLFDAKYWLFHVDTQLKQQKPQSINYTSLNIVALLNQEDWDLNHWIGVILELNDLIEHFFEIVFKGGPVLLVLGVFSERDVKIKTSLGFREVWGWGFGAFYYALALILFVMQRQALVLEGLEWGSKCWHLIICWFCYKLSFAQNIIFKKWYNDQNYSFF